MRGTLPLILNILNLISIVFSQHCEDDINRDCEERVGRGLCKGELGEGLRTPSQTARLLLAECRQSCRESLESETDLPPAVSFYGGLGDKVADPFGFEYPLCGQDGWGSFSSVGREKLLFQIGLNKEQLNWVPKFTEVGFEVGDIPSELYAQILEEYNKAMENLRVEECNEAVINCQEIKDDGTKSRLQNIRRTFMMDLSSNLQETIKDTFLPLAEAWSQVKLEHTSTYGIRRYTNGSWLVSHVDRFSTHVISAILNIGQGGIEEDWPLYIMDNSGEQHSVILEPGQIVWYESARLIHGRPKHFNGQYFDNMFIHYRPIGEWYKDSIMLGISPREVPITLEDVKRSQGEREKL